MLDLLIYWRSQIARRPKSASVSKHLRHGENTPAELAAFARALKRKPAFLPKFA